MTAFARRPRPEVIRHAEGRPSVIHLATDEDARRIAAEQDPFGIELHCTNPAGHQPIASCGEIVCCHCARVFWR